MMRTFIILLSYSLVQVTLADTISVLLEENCSPLSKEVRLYMHKENGVNNHLFCINPNLILTGVDIDSVKQIEKPSDEEMGEVAEEFALMRSDWDIPGLSTNEEIVYSEFEIVLSKSGESKFNDMRKGEKRIFLVYNDTLLSAMNFDRNGNEGNTIILLSDSLSTESKNKLKQYINNATK